MCCLKYDTGKYKSNKCEKETFKSKGPGWLCKFRGYCLLYVSGFQLKGNPANSNNLVELYFKGFSEMSFLVCVTCMSCEYLPTPAQCIPGFSKLPAGLLNVVLPVCTAVGHYSRYVQICQMCRYIWRIAWGQRNSELESAKRIECLKRNTAVLSCIEMTWITRAGRRPFVKHPSVEQ